MLRLSAPRVCRQQHSRWVFSSDQGAPLLPVRSAAGSSAGPWRPRSVPARPPPAAPAAVRARRGGRRARPPPGPRTRAAGPGDRPSLLRRTPHTPGGAACSATPMQSHHAVPAFPAVPARSLRSLHAVPMQPLRAAFSYPTTHPEGFLWWRCSNGMRRGRPRAAPAAGEGTARARTRGARRCARCGRLRPAGAGAPCARRGVPRCGAARLRGGLRRAGAGAAAAAARSHARPGAPACLCQRQILLAPARGHTRLQVARVQARRRPQRG